MRCYGKLGNGNSWPRASVQNVLLWFWPVIDWRSSFQHGIPWNRNIGLLTSTLQFRLMNENQSISPFALSSFQVEPSSIQPRVPPIRIPIGRLGDSSSPGLASPSSSSDGSSFSTAGRSVGPLSGLKSPPFSTQPGGRGFVKKWKGKRWRKWDQGEGEVEMEELSKGWELGTGCCKVVQRTYWMERWKEDRCREGVLFFL